MQKKCCGRDLKDYAREMISGPIVGLLLVLSNIIYGNLNLIEVTVIFALWYSAPFVAHNISKTKGKKKIALTKKEEDNLMEIAKRTWSFFEIYTNKENNFLPPDNFQIGRKKEITEHTSATNIGLGLLATISAYDLKFITANQMIDKLKNMIDISISLNKWNGHLYNWYNIKTLAPLKPSFVSTVDSGNFVGYLYVVKKVLEEQGENELKGKVEKLISDTDFSRLYDYDKNLFSIGYDLKENKLVDSYYDLLASEARQASFIAIAKRDISYKHWFYLGRALTTLNGYKGLVSWSGTMFEYYMPYVVMPSYEYSLLEEAYRFSLYSQKEYAKKLNIPWGISESAFNLQDLNYNYQYKAFGIPWLGLKRGLKEDVVVSPYSSIMTVDKNYKDVLENIEKLKGKGAYDKFGFYEAIDFTPSRVGEKKYEIVKTYMAHHQALILLSINNFLNEKILSKRFAANPEIRAVSLLLQEKIPSCGVYTKEKKEKINVLKYVDYEEYNEEVINNPAGNVNILSNDKYTLLINDLGEGYSKCGDIFVTKYNDSYRQSNIIYIKNLKTNEYWASTKNPTDKIPDEYVVNFSSAESGFYRKDGNIETITKIAVSSEDNLEFRKVEIRNNGDEEANIDIVSYVEIILTTQNSDIVHPVYNNLFLCSDNIDGKVLIEKRFQNGNKIYCTHFPVCEDNNIKFEVELDKAKIIGRGRDITNPLIIEENKMFSNNISSVANTVIAIKSSVLIKPHDSVSISYYTAVAEEKEEIKNIIKKYASKDIENRLVEMAKSKSLIENRFIGLKGKNIILYNKLFAEIINGSSSKNKYLDEIKLNKKNQRDLWKYGISGDNPIVLIKIKNVNDVFLIKQLINAVEYFLIKNIKIDLVVIDEEKGPEKYTGEKIKEYIYSKNISFLLGANGGIHVLNFEKIEPEDIKLIYACSDIIWDAKRGFMEELLEQGRT